MRVKLQEVETPDTWTFGYAITEDGRLVFPDYRKICASDNNGSIRWTTVWQDLPESAVVIKVAVSAKVQPGQIGHGFWQPIHLPCEQTDWQIIAVEKLLRLHDLALVAAVGLKQSGRRD